MNTSPWQTYPVNCDSVSGDLWCGGHTFLPDGKLLFVGGTSYFPKSPDPFHGGLKEAYFLIHSPKLGNGSLICKSDAGIPL